MTGEELKQAREAKHLSRAILADLAGVGEDQIANWEKKDVPDFAEKNIRYALGLKPIERKVIKGVRTSSGVRFGEEYHG